MSLTATTPTVNGAIDFRTLFLAPTALAIIAMVTLSIGFKPESLEIATAESALSG